VLTLSLPASALAQSPDMRPVSAAADQLGGTFAVTFGFGEIPFLSGSFKPSVSFGCHLNQYVYFGAILQLWDILDLKQAIPASRMTAPGCARNPGAPRRWA